MLDQQYQPITKAPEKLIIGISKILMSGVTPIDVGAITDASMDLVTTTKDRYIGYPQQRHSTVTDSVVGSVSFTAEEIGSGPVISLLEAIFSGVQTQVATTYGIDMIVPFASGDNFLLTSKIQVLPELSIDWQNDWSKVQFKFECVGNNAQSLITRTAKSGPRETATTINPLNLGIGLPKVTVDGTSVGSIQQATLTLQGQVRKVESGYPRCTARVVYLDSRFELNVFCEEIQLIPKNECPVILEQALVDGGALRFTFPNCTITRDSAFQSKNDWSGFRHKILPCKPGIDPIIIFERIMP